MRATSVYLARTLILNKKPINFLILSSSHDETANYLCAKLDEKKLEYVRIDSDSLSTKAKFLLSNNEALLQIDGTIISSALVKNLWFRRPKEILIKGNLSATDPRYQHISGEWGETLENFLTFIPEKSWINHPIANYKASHKYHQLLEAQKVGLKTPSTLITNQEDQLLAFFQKHEKKIIVKPLKSGFLENTKNNINTVIYTNEVTPETIANSNLVEKCPTFFQQKISKKRDIRVTILDEKVTAISLESNSHIDIRKNNMIGVHYSHFKLSIELENKLRMLNKKYNLRFSAIDLVESIDGEIYFLEINPNGQWAWLDIVGGAEIYKHFEELWGN